MSEGFLYSRLATSYPPIDLPFRPCLTRTPSIRALVSPSVPLRNARRDCVLRRAAHDAPTVPLNGTRRRNFICPLSRPLSTGFSTAPEKFAARESPMLSP